ncbi:MAG: hypothetical protein GF418_05530 [Chitinivibrionales bacterium]|nr:hypothetical protein [Chitinivibrionales bacterium]
MRSQHATDDESVLVRSIVNANLARIRHDLYREAKRLDSDAERLWSLETMHGMGSE